TEVDFELRDAVDDVIVDALAVAAVRLEAGLPVPFEDVAGVAVVGDPLRGGGARRAQQRRRKAQQGEARESRHRSRLPPVWVVPSGRIACRFTGVTEI